MNAARILVVAVLVVLGGRAAAQEAPTSEAKRLYDVGSEQYRARDFKAAEAAFEQAYALSKRKELLYNIALCHRELGELEPALDSFRQYLAFAGPASESAAEVRQQIADLERLVPAQLDVRSRGKPATITVDGTPRGTTPLVATLLPGAHQLVAEGAGPVDRRDLLLTAGEHRVLEVGRKSRTGLWVGVGIGAVVVVGVVVTAAVLATRPSDLRDGTLSPSTITVH